MNMGVSKCLPSSIATAILRTLLQNTIYVVFTATQKSGDHALHVSDVDSYALDF